MKSFVVLSAGMGGLATLYLIVILVMLGITLALLLAYVYFSNRTVATICYVAALTLVFPGVACIGNGGSIPPDYVSGFLEFVGSPLQAFEPDAGSAVERVFLFLMWLPIPALVGLVVAAPFLRPVLLARRKPRRIPRRA